MISVIWDIVLLLFSILHSFLTIHFYRSLIHLPKEIWTNLYCRLKIQCNTIINLVNISKFLIWYHILLGILVKCFLFHKFLLFPRRLARRCGYWPDFQLNMTSYFAMFFVNTWESMCGRHDCWWARICMSQA